MLIPIRLAAVGLKETARIAVPSFVFLTINLRIIISTTEVTRTTDGFDPMIAPD